MKLISLNVGQSAEVEFNGKTFSTAIFKCPVSGRRPVGTRGVEGDQQADLKHHGGTDKAVFVYAHDYYAHWAQVLDRNDLTPGIFGENFTVSGLTDDQVQVGDVYRVGEAVIQVSQPRAPCYKLSARLNDATIPEAYLKSGMVGFYVRILEAGTVAAGDAIDVVRRAENSMTVRELSQLYHFDHENMAEMRRALQIASLADAWREPLQQRLDKWQLRE